MMALRSVVAWIMGFWVAPDAHLYDAPFDNADGFDACLAAWAFIARVLARVDTSPFWMLGCSVAPMVALTLTLLASGTLIACFNAAHFDCSNTAVLLLPFVDRLLVCFDSCIDAHFDPWVPGPFDGRLDACFEDAYCQLHSLLRSFEHSLPSTVRRLGAWLLGRFDTCFNARFNTCIDARFEP
jgi:hypothetical protein